MTTELYDIFLQSSGVSIDTREDLSNKIFFALPGKNVDSNTFYKLAIEKGAIACVVSDKALIAEEKCFYFEDTLQTLQQLALRYREDLQIPVIGITGSNGKTTTKEILYSILKNQFKTHATAGNFNNFIGLPLTILSTPRDTEVLILEMGANAQGEIKGLSALGRPTHGLITSIGRAHLEGFGGLEGVIKTKFELFHYLDSSKGQSYINIMDETIEKHRNISETDIVISNDGFIPANVKYEVLSLNPYVEFKILSEKNELHIKSKLTGKHNWMNIVNAMALSLSLGVHPENIKKGIEDYNPQNSRSQWVKYRNSLLLLDAYNANPSSVRSMFTDFDDLKTSRTKIAILGEMAELGEESKEAHREILEMLRTSKSVHEYYLVGNMFDQAINEDEREVYPTVLNLKKSLPPDFYEANYIIMVKGSRSVRLEELFDASNFESFDSFD